jgi:hypothetical protein
MPNRMSHDEFVSKLPVFGVKRSEQWPGFLIVMCGRKDCPGTKAGRPFVVSEKEWLRPFRVRKGQEILPTIITGRACPYCFRAGRIPRRVEIG